jgi:hypothetical protein
MNDVPNITRWPVPASLRFDRAYLVAWLAM